MNYKSESCFMEVKSFTNMLKKNCDLNPVYQRSVVWSEGQQGLYICAVFENKAPHNIIFSKSKNKKRICIDGKQRSSSILNFIQNKVPMIYDKKSVYYTKIPEDVSEEKVRVMTKNERNCFDDRRIGVIDYDKLTYEQQSSLFNNLQYGVPLSQGEKITSNFKNKENAILYNETCDKYKDKLQKFLNTSRKEHCKYVALFMYIANKRLSTSAKEINEYLQELEEEDTLEIELKKISKPFNYILDILNDNNIKKKHMNKKLFTTILYCFNKKYKELSNYNNKSVLNFLIKFLTSNDIENYDMSQPQNTVYTHVEDEFDSMYKKTVKKNLFKKSKLIEKNDSDSEDLDSEDSNNEESENEESENEESDNEESENEESDDEESDDEESDNEKSNNKEANKKPKVKKNKKLKINNTLNITDSDAESIDNNDSSDEDSDDSTDELIKKHVKKGKTKDNSK